MLLYAVLYAVATAVVCVTGSIHPFFFVCYQITAGLLLSSIIIRAFRRVQAPGAAVCLFLGIFLLLLIIRDAVMWHVVPLTVITTLAEIVRAMAKYSRAGDIVATVLMIIDGMKNYTAEDITAALKEGGIYTLKEIPLFKARRASRCAACGLPERQHLPFSTRVHYITQRGTSPLCYTDRVNTIKADTVREPGVEEIDARLLFDIRKERQ